MLKLTIATGKSRTDVKWKNQEVTWEKLKDRLKETKRTPETVAQYKEMTKAQQGEVKDVGGFVGGRLNGDRRTSRNIDKRSLIVLDLDYATADALGDIDMLCDFYWAAYSTHTHTPDKPRYRLLVPTDRPVAADEYEPVARWLAELVGIEQCDASTYDPARLMYWPSTSADGEFVYSEGGLGPLGVDRVLASYPDWRNPIYWPTAEREARAEVKRLEKAEDPRGKTGTIGAFCRCYGVAAAMAEFLADEYEMVAEGRYTYKAGSTAGGAKVYSDLWVYSHHGTDPCGGQLVNAFDLVRIHKFGVLDKDVASDTKVNRLPSYEAMLAWAVELEPVAKELTCEKAAEIELDFGGVDWATKLERTKHGDVKPTIENVAVILLNAPDFKGKMGLNLLTGQVEVREKLPWSSRLEHFPRDWADLDDANLRLYMQSTHGISGKELVYDGFAVATGRCQFHPVREFLDNLPAWDGVPRVERLLVDYFGAEDCELTRAMTRKTLVAAIERIMNPGCKFDQMLILQGPQGIGKSTLWKKLADPWFSDSIRTMEGKEAYEQLKGIWIGEMGELTATKRSEVEAQKAFLSSQEDHYRPAYGRRIEKHKRQCILVGTTNEHEFLKDRTGNRRFWTVKLDTRGSKSVWALDKETVEQIWAEAKRLRDRGETLYLPSELDALIAQNQEDFTEDSGLDGIVAEYLIGQYSSRWHDMTLVEKRDFLRGFRSEDEELVPLKQVCALEIAVLAMNEERPRVGLLREIRDSIRKQPGWVDVGRQSTGKPFGQQRCFQRRLSR